MTTNSEPQFPGEPAAYFSNVVQRTRIQQNKADKFARFHGTQIALPENPRRICRCRKQQLQLFVQTETLIGNTDGRIGSSE
jgi:hypothetical protein